jgi:hypothetical protein
VADNWRLPANLLGLLLDALSVLLPPQAAKSAVSRTGMTTWTWCFLFKMNSSK